MNADEPVALDQLALISRVAQAFNSSLDLDEVLKTVIDQVMLRLEAEGVSALLRPLAVGLGTTVNPERTGTLFLKINDSAAELDDNAGTLAVEVRAEEQAAADE